MRLYCLAAPLLALLACAEPAEHSTPRAYAADTADRPANSGSRPVTLAERLDCLRSSGGVLLIAHRGGPTQHHPENAIETFENTLKTGIRGIEVDIAETRDGHLILMHDDDLERTTTGSGRVAAQTLADIQALRLQTPALTTDFQPPTLEATLAFAVRNNIIVELDKKRSASFSPIIAAVRAAGAENHVFVITYTDDQAVEVHRQAPELVITATIRTLDDADRLIARGVRPTGLVAWTGTNNPDPALWRGLAARGIETAFGTLGPPDRSLDARFWADGDGAEYNALVDSGLPILVTDRPDRTARQLGAFMDKAGRCGL